MVAKLNYVLVFCGFVLELEQILKNDRLRVGQGRITCSDNNINVFPPQDGHKTHIQ